MPRWLAGKRNHIAPAVHPCASLALLLGAGRWAAGMTLRRWPDALQLRTFLFSRSCFEIHRIYFLKPFVPLFI